MTAQSNPLDATSDATESLNLRPHHDATSATSVLLLPIMGLMSSFSRLSITHHTRFESANVIHYAVPPTTTTNTTTNHKVNQPESVNYSPTVQETHSEGEEYHVYDPNYTILGNARAFRAHCTLAISASTTYRERTAAWGAGAKRSARAGRWTVRGRGALVQ